MRWALAGRDPVRQQRPGKELHPVRSGRRDGLEWLKAVPKAKDTTFEQISIGLKQRLARGDGAEGFLRPDLGAVVPQVRKKSALTAPVLNSSCRRARTYSIIKPCPLKVATPQMRRCGVFPF
jgi:hypothetical protein